MCGRFTLTTDIKTLKNVFQLKEYIFDYIPRYNIAPGQNIHVIIKENDSRKLRLMKWGLIPGWARESKIATHDQRPVRRQSTQSPPIVTISARCCLIPAELTEWSKQPDPAALGIILPGSALFFCRHLGPLDIPGGPHCILLKLDYCTCQRIPQRNS